MRRFGLKPREAEPGEAGPRTGDGTALSVDLIHRMNQAAEARAAAQDPAPVAGPDPAADDANGVSRMLRENLDAALGSQPELIELPRPRRSGRRRDMAVVLALCGLAAAGVAVVFRGNLPAMGAGFLALGFLASLCGWIIFGMMDRY